MSRSIRQFPFAFAAILAAIAATALTLTGCNKTAPDHLSRFQRGRLTTRSGEAAPSSLPSALPAH